MKDATWFLSCMASGPMVLHSRDDEFWRDVSCSRQKGHLNDHQWFSDDGSVRVTWYDEWNIGEGAWRQAVPE